MVQTHLPGYLEDYEQLKAKGVEVVACLSVNDAFVMAAWGKASGADGKIRMLADPTAAFTKVTLHGLNTALVALIMYWTLCCRQLTWSWMQLQYSATLAANGRPGIGSCSVCCDCECVLCRFSMLIEDSIVTALNLEPDGTGLTCSLSNALLERL